MLCDGPQHHEGGCTFTQGWQLARKLEDELASIAGYAGDTTNELRETRERVEAAEARCARLRQALKWYDEHKRTDGFYDSNLWGDLSEMVDTPVCARCQGHGTVGNSGVGTVSDCDECGGTGRTENGTELPSEALSEPDTPAPSPQDCEHDYVFVHGGFSPYRCDKCGRTSKDGVYPKIGSFHPHAPQEPRP